MCYERGWDFSCFGNNKTSLRHCSYDFVSQGPYWAFYKNSTVALALTFPYAIAWAACKSTSQVKNIGSRWLNLINSFTVVLLMVHVVLYPLQKSGLAASKSVKCTTKTCNFTLPNPSNKCHWIMCFVCIYFAHKNTIISKN